MIDKYVEEIARDCFLEDLSKTVNEETANVIIEAVDHPETLYKLNSWEELGI
jgi:hypothetical protein